MIERKDIEKLAALARIDIPENQIEKFQKDIDSILAYVGKIGEAGVKMGGAEAVGAQRAAHAGTESADQVDIHIVKNVMREDGEPHQTGTYTDAILAEVPETENGYIKVKKILDN